MPAYGQSQRTFLDGEADLEDRLHFYQQSKEVCMVRTYLPSRRLGLRWILAAATIAVVTVATCHQMMAGIQPETVIAYWQ